jgi:hypothetical protein
MLKFLVKIQFLQHKNAVQGESRNTYALCIRERERERCKSAKRVNVNIHRLMCTLTSRTGQCA